LTNIITFALTFFTMRGYLLNGLAFASNDWMERPWSLATYPLVASGGIIELLFSGIWLWFAGGSLERAWGSQRFALFFFGISAITALFFGAGASLLQADFGLSGLTMPLASLTVAWCMLNPEQTILFYFFFPLKAKHLAWLTVALVYFLNGPLFGFFALGGILTTWLYIRFLRLGVAFDGGYGGPIGERLFRPRRSARPRESVRSWWNPLSWVREWQENRRLRRLLNPPDFSDPDEDTPPPADRPQ